ncbi:MAG: glycosyltransferase family 2 protein [Gemmataceae bacterium]
MNDRPLISVSLVTYNHEKYIGQAIRSVLNQTCSDIEVVVVTDGSTDGTAQVINSFTDPRVVTVHQTNRGPSAATNKAISTAKGRYVALFSGDDVCKPNRLEAQLKEYQRGESRVLFSDIDFIDEFGSPIEAGHFAQSSFASERLSRAEMLARLFHRGNFLNGVTVFTEREIMARAPYDEAMLQLSDFDLWVRLIGQYPLQILPFKLLSYRIRSGGQNLSAPDADSHLRSANEHYFLLRRFFDTIPCGLFRDAFADSLIRPDFQDGLEYACERAFLYTRTAWPMGRLIGTELLHDLLSNSEAAEVLASKYNFGPVQFFELLRTADALNLFGGEQSSIFYDTGDGWSASQEVKRLIQPAPGDFILRFKMPAISGLKAMRWDPVENRLARLKVHAVELRDTLGKTQTLTLADMGHNGRAIGDGCVEFETHDPSFWWYASGDITSVTISGEWEFQHIPESLAALRKENERLRDELTAAKASAAKKLVRRAWRLLKAS